VAVFGAAGFDGSRVIYKQLGAGIGRNDNCSDSRLFARLWRALRVCPMSGLRSRWLSKPRLEAGVPG